MTAITFPRFMLTTRAMQQEFELQRVDYLSPEVGGRIGSVTAGPPLWLMSIQYNNLLPAEGDALRVWVNLQRGAQRTFLAYDIDHKFPAAYPAGFTGLVIAGTSTPFLAVAAAWSRTANADGLELLTLTGFPAAYVITAHDYIGFRWGTGGAKRALVRVMEGAVADGSGNVTIVVEPAVPLTVPSDAVAHVSNPCAAMRLTPDTKLAPTGLDGTTSGGRVVAVQDLVA